ncbi:MAG TPA: cyclic nucleotide-binding domain-containing protein [Candidatus Limnocylindrales bacterium]|nr:cyclic nucleotide-binding domain-containing protein [Candidatus Limnocylindrales bacterium]
MDDALTLTQDRRSELLAACRLFSGVGPEDLAAVASRAVEVDFPANHVIARQGEIGTGFFLVVSGSVRVIRGGQQVAVLGPGEFFGELSVLDGQPRVAQVVATEPTRCLALASWDFEQALLESPSLALSILRGLAARLRSVTEQQNH